jgi:hypothetical protein
MQAPLPRLYRRAEGPPPAGYTVVPAPNIQMRVSEASATTVPWVDANGWRFLRGLKQALYEKVPTGRAALAAAEAAAYGVDALIESTDEDRAAFDAMLTFLKSTGPATPQPTRANMAIVDSGSEALEEVLNLLSRRNLLYKVVRAPDPSFTLNIRLGSREWPEAWAEDPNQFAARVRERITDDKRLVRLFGTGSYNVMVHLTGDRTRSRLHLLNYGRRPARELRVRVLGAYSGIRLFENADPKQIAADQLTSGGATEFTIPILGVYAVCDLAAAANR